MSDHKRQRSSPTYSTPTRPRKRVPLRPLVCSPQRAEANEAALPRQARLEFGGSSASVNLPIRKCGGSSKASYSRQLADVWSEAEIKALVEFIVIRCGEESKWPTHHGKEFWKSAASFISTSAKSTCQRSGKFIISSNILMKKYFKLP